jgi:hypothetical protein
MTKPRPRIDRLPHLPMGAVRWLLGRRPYYRKDGTLAHSSIIRWRFLHAHACSEEEWERVTSELWAAYGSAIRERARLRRLRRAEAKKLAREARKARREAAEALPP